MVQYLYMFSLFFEHPLLFFLNAIALISALSIHEFAHAWTADKLGDPTPRLQGRLTLNPLKHLDPLGTLLLFVMGFGWGKPVEFDPYNLRHPRRDSGLIALAGPVSNIATALLLSLILQVVALPEILGAVVLFTIRISLVLAVFNFIPVHPLDGGKIVVGFLPKETALEWDAIMHRWGFLILLFLIFPLGNSGSPVSYLVTPIVNGLFSLMVR
jgi:Zn-dependent protease